MSKLSTWIEDINWNPGDSPLFANISSWNWDPGHSAVFRKIICPTLEAVGAFLLVVYSGGTLAPFIAAGETALAATVGGTIAGILGTATLIGVTTAAAEIATITTDYLAHQLGYNVANAGFFAQYAGSIGAAAGAWTELYGSYSGIGGTDDSIASGWTGFLQSWGLAGATFSMTAAAAEAAAFASVATAAWASELQAKNLMNSNNIPGAPVIKVTTPVKTTGKTLAPYPLTSNSMLMLALAAGVGVYALSGNSKKRK